VPNRQVRCLILGNGPVRRIAPVIILRDLRVDRARSRVLTVQRFRISCLSPDFLVMPKGSFTGAHKDSKGILEQAHKGTGFYGRNWRYQSVYAAGTFTFYAGRGNQPIGKNPKKVDVRIIGATNKTIDQLSAGERFRPDLFFRFGVILELPPFYTYPAQEKLQVIEQILRKRAKIFSRPVVSLCKELKNFLLSYRMPGNYRELINIIDHFYVFASNNQPCMDELPYHIRKKPVSFTKISDIERDHILKIYPMFNRNKTQTAKALGISVNTLKNKLRLYGIE